MRKFRFLLARRFALAAVCAGLLTATQLVFSSAASAGPPGPTDAVPAVTCVSVQAGGSFIAYFGYSNTGSAQTIPAGPTNSLTPPSLGTPQTTNFVAGTVSDAFNVTVPKATTAKWSIFTNSASATSASTACSGSTLPVDPLGVTLLIAIGGGAVWGAVVVRKAARGRRRA